MFGLMLSSLDRLFHAVERHAKATGEWRWLVQLNLLFELYRVRHMHLFLKLTFVVSNSLRQDIIDLGKPSLQTTYKLVVTSRMERVYECLLPSLKQQQHFFSFISCVTTSNLSWKKIMKKEKHPLFILIYASILQAARSISSHVVALNSNDFEI